MTVSEGIQILTQIVTLATVVGGVFVSVGNRRVNRKELNEVRILVNGKSEKLERLIGERAFRAGQQEEKENPSPAT